MGHTDCSFMESLFYFLDFLCIVSKAVEQSRLGDNVQLTSPAVRNVPGKENSRINNFAKELGQSVLGPYTFASPELASILAV